MEQLYTAQVKIADIVLSISSDKNINPLLKRTNYRDFLCDGDPEVIIQAHYDGLPDLQLNDKERIFDSLGAWSLYRINGKYVYSLKSPLSEPLPYRIAIFASDYCHGEVFNPIQTVIDQSGDSISNPMEYPLSEIHMVSLLSQRRGLMIHACGLDDNGQGYLFAGNSTHGKTTMARQWKEESTVLNDDRIVIRHQEGRFWMYGTPWHGEYDEVAPHGVPLEKIFFLSHEEENNALEVKGVKAASKLLARAFPPLWDQDGMDFSLDFCADLVNNVSCYELGFVPNGGIVDYVRCLI